MTSIRRPRRSVVSAAVRFGRPGLLNVLLAILAPVVVSAALVAGGPDALLALPLLVCLVPLLLGRYAGEDKLHTLARWVGTRRSRRRASAATMPQARPGAALTPRGGRLIAASLAVRPPPAAAPSPA